MGYVNPNAHDIFVSYASVNNRPVPKRDRKPWVDVLAQAVSEFVDQKLGRRGLCSTFMDRGLAGNCDFEKDIMEALDGAAVLLLVLSEGYLSSEWCLKEVGRFYEVFQKRRDAGNPVFVIEYEPVERPPFLKPVTGYQFWVQSPLIKRPPYITMGYRRSDEAQDEFDNQVEIVGHDLAAELLRLRKVVRSGFSGTSSPPTPNG